MPFPPSLGLSDLIHLSVIIWNKIANKIRKSPSKFKKNMPSTIRSIISVTIIVVITIIICTGASSIIYVSATEKHSMVHLAFKSYKYLSSHYSNYPTLAVNITPKIMGAKTDCATSTEDVVVLNTESVIDYLKSKNQDFSFETREELAVKYGISDYSGDVDQNFIILKNLMKEDRDKVKQGGGACNLSESMSILETQYKN